MWYIGQALSLLSMFKLGYYLKIPERPMFWGQMWGTAIVPLVNYGVTRLVLDNIDHAMLKGIKHSVSWNALGTKAWYSASILWVCMGQLQIVLDDMTFFTNLLYRGWLVLEECLALVCFFSLFIAFSLCLLHTIHTAITMWRKKILTSAQQNRIRIQLRLLWSSHRLPRRRSHLLSPTLDAQPRNGILPQRTNFFPIIQWNPYCTHDIFFLGLYCLSCLVSYSISHSICNVIIIYWRFLGWSGGGGGLVWDIFFDVIRFGGQITIIYLLWLLLAGWLFKGLWWLLRLICRGLTFRTLSIFFFIPFCLFIVPIESERERGIPNTADDPYLRDRNWWGNHPDYPDRCFPPTDKLPAAMQV